MGEKRPKGVERVSHIAINERTFWANRIVENISLPEALIESAWMNKGEIIK